MPAIKTREFPFEIKSMDDHGTFSGYGSVFDVVDSYKDRVKKGAFLRSLAGHEAKKSMPAMFYNHSVMREIGEWLVMREDAHGLWVEGKLWIDGANPDPDALKAYRGMRKAKGKMGLSIGYSVPEAGAVFDPKTSITDLVQIDLWETSPVIFPANDVARIETVKGITTVRDFERFLRDSGFSRTEATALAAKGFKVLGNQGEPDSELMETARQLIQSMKS